MITVDPRSAVPPFEQVRVQLVEQVRSGDLDAGVRLPTVRRLAEDLGIAPNTVARAYRELENEGVIVTRGRHGSFVATVLESPEAAGQRAAREFVQRIQELRIAPDAAMDWVRSALAE